MSDYSKYFVQSFLKFLQKQIRERDFSPDVIESLEVATQCLEAAYELPSSAGGGSDESDEVSTAAAGSSSGGNVKNPLQEIDVFDLYKTICIDNTPGKKDIAEEVKNEGNRLMKEGKFNEALTSYNKAISLDATNPVFYCNRAAAWIRLSEFEKAISDCKMSLLYNPSYGKAYGRMGIAYSNLQKFELAVDSYEKALELEPDNQDYQNNLRISQQRIESGGVQQQQQQQQPNLGGTQNWSQNIIQNIPIDNPDFRNLISEMLADPMISMASRQVASQLVNQYPDVISGVRHQLMDMAAQAAQAAASTDPSQQSPDSGSGPDPSNSADNAGSGGGQI